MQKSSYQAIPVKRLNNYIDTSAHSRLCIFGNVSIRDCIQSKWCKLGIVSIRNGVSIQDGASIREGVHSILCSL